MEQTNLPSAPNSYSWQTKMDVVARYMLLGNMRVVSEVTGISYHTLADWKKEDWWQEMVEQIRRQKKLKSADTLTKIIETSVEIIQDRLEHGDFILNNKTGEIMRKPVGVKDANMIANQLMQRQAELEEVIDRTATKQDSIKETLDLLAKEFQKMNRRSNNQTAEDAVLLEK